VKHLALIACTFFLAGCQAPRFTLEPLKSAAFLQKEIVSETPFTLAFKSRQLDFLQMNGLQEVLARQTWTWDNSQFAGGMTSHFLRLKYRSGREVFLSVYQDQSSLSFSTEASGTWFKTSLSLADSEHLKKLLEI
jgi:hypothetical protein